MTEQHDSSPTDPVRVSSSPEDVASVRKIMEDTDIAMVTTVDSSGTGRLTSRPLSTQRADRDGDVVFLTRRDSALVRDITANPQVNVAYASRKAWVSLAGTAAVVEDRGLVKELWSKGADLFMEGGPENPNNIALRVEGDTAELWGGDSLIGTAVSMVKAITGNKDDDGTVVVELP